MRVGRFIASLLVFKVLIFCSIASAEPIALESFDFEGNVIGAGSGEGWNGGWYGGVDGIASYQIAEGLGYENPSVKVESAGGAAYGYGKIFRNLQAPIAVEEPKTIWASFLMNLHTKARSGTRIGYQSAISNITLFGSGEGRSVITDEMISFGVTVRSLSHSQFGGYFSLFSQRGGASARSTIPFNFTDSVVLVVLKLDLRPNADFPGDVLMDATLYVDPTMKSASDSPKPILAMSGANIGKCNPISIVRIEAGQIRTSLFKAKVDEIRFGETLADVLVVKPNATTPYMAWSAVLPEGARAADDDADQDGIVNAFEFLYGLDPLEASDPALLRHANVTLSKGSSLHSNAAQYGLDPDAFYRVISYQLPKSTARARIEVEASTTLDFNDGSAAAYSYQTFMSGGDFITQYFYLTPPVSETNRLFWRLSASLDEE